MDYIFESFENFCAFLKLLNIQITDNETTKAKCHKESKVTQYYIKDVCPRFPIIIYFCLTDFYIYYTYTYIYIYAVIIYIDNWVNFSKMNFL